MARRSTFGAHGLHPRAQLAVVALFAVAGLVAAWGALEAANDALFTLLSALALVGLGFAATLAWGLRFGRKQGAVVEGGVEWRGALGAGHVPFEALRDATLEDPKAGTLRLDTQDGRRVRVQLGGGDRPGELERALRGIHAARVGVADVAHLARGGDALDVWAARVRSFAGAGGDYRMGALDAERLHAVLADPARAEDVRAACAYALLTMDGARWAEKVGAFATIDAPPILLVMIRLAPGGAALVDDGTFAAATRLLDDRDRGDLAEAAEGEPEEEAERRA